VCGSRTRFRTPIAGTKSATHDPPSTLTSKNRVFLIFAIDEGSHPYKLIEKAKFIKWLCQLTMEEIQMAKKKKAAKKATKKKATKKVARKKK